MKIGVIDMGTNSFHFILARLSPSAHFEVLLRDKEMVGLGKGAMVTGELEPEAMENALETLKRFLYLAQKRGADQIIAISTSAVRESKNGGDFLDRIKRETKLKVQIITGQEEARLIGLAVQKSFVFSSQKNLIMDIGGGSTELILSDSKKNLWCESVKLGSNRLSQAFVLSDPPKNSEIKKLEAAIKEEISVYEKPIRNFKPDCLVGTSGTLECVFRMLQKMHGHKDSQHEYLAKDLMDLYGFLKTKKLSELEKVKGLDKKRIKMIVQGAAIAKVAVDLFGIKTFRVCDQALREGVLYDFIEKNEDALKIEEKIPDPRRRSVRALLRRFPEFKEHCKHVAFMSLRLFDDLLPLHGLGAPERELLEFSALLHDIGYAVSYRKHHQHSYYLIQNANLIGFSPEEISIIASIAKLHRKSVSPRDIEELALSLENKEKVLCLAGLLRIADALDRSHNSLIEDVAVSLEKKQIVIELETNFDVQWEIHEAKKRQDLLESVFNKKVIYETKRRNKRKSKKEARVSR
ncbi:MAG: Ppx/GppA family phosphatase [Deltaproteobacteria bacterium]|nr:Ppx/GppA family phosphatase [Deltaproteobacteria bacterium]